MQTGEWIKVRTEHIVKHRVEDKAWNADLNKQRLIYTPDDAVKVVPVAEAPLPLFLRHCAKRHDTKRVVPGTVRVFVSSVSSNMARSDGKDAAAEQR